MKDATTTSLQRKYEAVVIMHPDASEEEQKNLFRKNRDIVKSFKGEINHLDTWGKRRLANPIHKLNRGIYFHTTFQAEGNAIAELERTMRINDRVLRFTHTRLDDRVILPKYLEEFKSALADAIQREKEREIKLQARKQAAMAARRDRSERSSGDRGGGGGGGRFDRYEDEEDQEG